MDLDLHAIFFWIMAVWSGVCAIGVVVTQNIVRAATWLLFALAGVSGVFFLLGADFVAASQLLIYVGGTLVLVVFGVMLTAQGPFVNLKTGAGEWAVSIVVGALLFGVLAVDTQKLEAGAAARCLPWETVDLLVTELDVTDARLDPFRDRVEIL